MATSQIVLFALVLHAMALGLGVVTVRVHAQVTQGRKANSFLHDGTDLGVLAQRITRDHGNSMEWIAVPATILLFAIATGQTHVTDPLAVIALGGRFAQTATHLISTSPAAVSVRGTCLGVQVIIWIYWGLQFITTAS